MDNPDPKTKNKEYVNKYRSKQKALGRRARLFYLTDQEAEIVRETIRDLRTGNLGPGVFGVDYPG